jgi:hypothetical protein
MSMSMPGAVRPYAAAPVNALQKRAGLIRMLSGSDHLIPIQPKDGAPTQIVCKARARLEHPKAKTVHICLNSGCSGKSWPSFALMAAGHPDAHLMAKSGAIHVYGLWSEDPVDAKNPGAGVLGLIAPASPVAEEE